MATVGAFVVACLGIPLPDSPATDDQIGSNDFIVQQYWRVVWGIPILLSIL